MELSYTTTNHIARKKLKLSMHEYAVADVIYHLSNNPKSEHPGWCYASKNTIGEILDLGMSTVKRCITVLINKKLLQKAPETKFLKTTSYWYDNVIIGDRVKMNHPSPKWSGDRVKMNHPYLASEGVKMDYNKDIYNDNNKKVSKETMEKIEKKKQEIRDKLHMKISTSGNSQSR